MLEALAAARLEVPVLHLGLPDRFSEHGDPARLLASCGLDAKGIAASILARFGTRRGDTINCVGGAGEDPPSQRPSGVGRAPCLRSPRRPLLTPSIGALAMLDSHGAASSVRTRLGAKAGAAAAREMERKLT